MKTSTKIVSAFIAASAVALAVPLAAHAEAFGEGRHCSSHERGHKGGRHAGGDMHRMLRGLDLSEAQRDAIFELRHAQAPQMRTFMKQMRASRKALRELATSAEYDAAKAQQLAQQGAQAMAGMALARANMGAEVFKLLDEKQREQFRQRMDRGKGMKHMHGMPARPLAS